MHACSVHVLQAREFYDLVPEAAAQRGMTMMEVSVHCTQRHTLNENLAEYMSMCAQRGMTMMEVGLSHMHAQTH